MKQKFKEDLENDTSELIYKTTVDPQTQETKLWLPNGKQEEG